MGWNFMKSTHSIHKEKSLSQELQSEWARMQMNQRSGAREWANKCPGHANERTEEGMAQYSSHRFHMLSTQCAVWRHRIGLPFDLLSPLIVRLMAESICLSPSIAQRKAKVLSIFSLPPFCVTWIYIFRFIDFEQLLRCTWCNLSYERMRCYLIDLFVWRIGGLIF